MKKVEIRAGIRKRKEHRCAVATATVREENGRSIIKIEKIEEIQNEGSVYQPIWKALRRLLDDPFLKILCRGEDLIEL